MRTSWRTLASLFAQGRQRSAPWQRKLHSGRHYGSAFKTLGDGTYRRISVRIVLQSGTYAAVQSSRLAGVSRVVTSGAYELLPFAVGGDSS